MSVSREQLPVMPNRTFDEWINCIFNHPVDDPAWYWAEMPTYVSTPTR